MFLRCFYCLSLTSDTHLFLCFQARCWEQRGWVSRPSAPWAPGFVVVTHLVGLELSCRIHLL